MYLSYEKKIKENLFLFFFILYFLIFISFLASYLTTVHYLFTMESSYSGSLLGRILFLGFIFMYLVKPKTGQIVYNILTSNFVIDFIYIASLKLEQFIKRRPILSFYFAYIYLLLLMLHWFMILFVGIDYYVEFAYHCFNIIRLVIFPLFIFSFVASYGPRMFNVFDGPNINAEEVLKILKGAATFIQDVTKTHPIKTKVGVGVTTTAAVLTAGAMAYGTSQHDQIMNKADAPVIKDLIDKLSGDQCLNNANCRELANETIRVFAKANDSKVTISLNDVTSMANGNPTIGEYFLSLLDKLPQVHAEAYRQALMEKEQEIVAKLANSNPTVVVEEDLDNVTSQAIVLSKPTGPHSPLELVDFWYFFF